MKSCGSLRHTGGRAGTVTSTPASSHPLPPGGARPPPDGSVLEEGSFDVNVPALPAVWLSEPQDFTRYGFHDCYYSYELLDEGGSRVGGGSVLFCAPKHFKFVDPGLTARVDGDEIVVTASAYARSVELQCGPDTVLEDNFFDMNPGERRVKILRGSAGNVKARSVYDIR